MAYKVYVSDAIAEQGLDLLRSACEVTYDPKITFDELMGAIPEYDALVVRSRTKVTKELIEAGRNLKVIGRAGVGLDNIDVEAAEAAGITVVNSPLAATNAVAEHTMAMLLSLVRKVALADHSLKEGKWEKSRFMGIELSGKTLGLLGLGRIGKKVAELASAFEMKVLAYDPYLTPEQIRAGYAEPASFDEVLQKSDFISLHLPLTDETKGLLGKEQIASMKKGVFLVCTARGGVIDEDALREALENETVAGAALDVFAVEPAPPDSIACHPKVTATPHISAQTLEAQSKAGIAIAEEVIAVLREDR